jgi:hypothetical protein
MSEQAGIVGFQTIPSTLLSGAGTTKGDWMNLRSMSKVTFQAEWTGTLAGTFTWEVTNYRPGSDPARPPSTAKATTLSTSFPAASNPAGAAGDFMFEFVNMGETWIRPSFVYASGSGNLLVTASAKT